LIHPTCCDGAPSLLHGVHGCLHFDVCAVSYVEMAASIDGAELMEELAMAANGGSAMERNDCKLVREANGDRGKAK